MHLYTFHVPQKCANNSELLFNYVFVISSACAALSLFKLSQPRYFSYSFYLLHTTLHYILYCAISEYPFLILSVTLVRKRERERKNEHKNKRRHKELSASIRSHALDLAGYSQSLACSWMCTTWLQQVPDLTFHSQVIITVVQLIAVTSNQ